MTREHFLARLIVAAVVAVILAVILYLAMGPRWFGFYGAAAIALVMLPTVTRALWQRFRATGRSGWRALLVALPVGLAALVQAGYWLAYFASGPSNPSLGIAREMVRPVLDMALPWAGLALAALTAWTIASAARDPDTV